MSISIRRVLSCAGMLSLGLGGLWAQTVPPSDADRDGFAAPVDCQDHDPSVHPGALDRCNGVDDDCDGTLDPGCSCLFPGVGSGPQVLAATWAPFGTAWGSGGGYVAGPFANATVLRRVDRFGRLLYEPPPVNDFSAEDIAVAGDGIGMVSAAEFVATDRRGLAPGAAKAFCTPEPGYDCAGPARIAWASDRFGIAWFRTGPVSDPLQFRTVDHGGEAVGPVLSPALPRGDRLALAASPDVFAVVFGDARNLHVWTVRRSDLTTHGPTELFHSDAVDGISTPPSIVWNGDSFGVAWAFESSEGSALHLREVSPDAVPGPLRAVSLLPQDVVASWFLELAWAADRYAVTYGVPAGWFDKQFYLVTFDRLGQYLAHTVFPVASLKPWSGLEWTGEGFVALVQDDAWNREVMAYAVGENCTTDADGDGWCQCVDEDDADSRIWTAAGEVRRLDLAREVNGVRLTWSGEWAAGGGPETFDVVDVVGSRLGQDGGYASATCAAAALSEPSWLDERSGPSQGQARCYLVRAHNRLGPGTFGEGGTFPDPRDPLDRAGPCP